MLSSTRCGRQRCPGAEDRDAERPAELGARLEDGRGRPGALGRSGADDEVVRQREDRRDAQRVDERRADQDTQSGVDLDLREPEQAYGRDCEAARRSPGGRTRFTKTGATIEPSTNAPNEGERHQSGLERRELEDELQVLVDEEEGAEQHQDPERVDGQRGAEGRDSERFRSMSGSASLVCRRTKIAPKTRPAAIAANETLSTPSCVVCFSPYTTASTAIRDRAALVRSTGRHSGRGTRAEERPEDQEQRHHREGQEKTEPTRRTRARAAKRGPRRRRASRR